MGNQHDVLCQLTFQKEPAPMSISYQLVPIIFFFPSSLDYISGHNLAWTAHPIHFFIFLKLNRFPLFTIEKKIFTCFTHRWYIQFFWQPSNSGFSSALSQYCYINSYVVCCFMHSEMICYHSILGIIQ